MKSRGVTITNQRDIKKKPLSLEEVKSLAAKAGGAEALFSRRSVQYRALGLAKKTLAEADLLRLMSEQYTFIKRPVIVAGTRALAGFSAKACEEFLS